MCSSPPMDGHRKGHLCPSGPLALGSPPFIFRRLRRGPALSPFCRFDPRFSLSAKTVWLATCSAERKSNKPLRTEDSLTILSPALEVVSASGLILEIRLVLGSSALVFCRGFGDISPPAAVGSRILILLIPVIYPCRVSRRSRTPVRRLK